MANIIQLKDRSTSTDQYPVTLTEAVVDANGAHLSDTIADLPTIRSQAAAAYAPAASPATDGSTIDTADQLPFYDTSAAARKGITLAALVAKLKSLLSSVYAAASHTHSFSAISARGEAFLDWGGKNIAGGVTPIDASGCDEFSHNKLAFLPAGCVTVEYTTDGGTTWLDYGMSDANKIAMITTTGAGAYIGKNLAKSTDGTLTAENCANYQVRVVISTRDTDGKTKLYTAAKKMLINISSNGASGMTVKVEVRTIANYNNDVDSWTVRGTYNVSGWSAWNSIPFTETFGGSTTQTNQIAQARFTLSITGVSASYASVAQFIDFRLRGITNWTMPSELARAGRLYTLDTSKNVTFPAKVTASSFAGPLTGNVTGNCSGSAGSVAWSAVTGKPSTFSPSSHTHTKSQISDFPSSLPASDVSAWAKAASKPTYTASEVGAAAASHTHSYAGSSSAGGAATSANKLNTNAGSTTNPVYFSGGVPVACTSYGSASVNYSNYSGYLSATSLDTESSITESGLRCYVGGGSSWGGDISSMAYAAILAFGTPSRGWQIWARRGDGSSGSLHFRVGIDAATSWNTERILIDSVNYTSYCAAASHTHSYAGSSSAGGAATSANKVNAALTFNSTGSGSAAGTTFNGSAAKTISYNTVGAAAASHTHTKSQISDFPSSLPASDVSAWAKADTKPTYTASEVGAAAASHTHSYAGSSSAGGAATSANKVNAALTFNSTGSGNAAGTTFNGSAAKTISYNTVGAAAASHTHTIASLTDGGSVVSTDTTGTKPAGSIPAWSGSGNTITTQLGKGSATNPIYLDDGIPTACSFDLSGFQFSTSTSGTTIGGNQTLTFDDDFELGAACEYGVTNTLSNSNNLITAAAVYTAIGDIETLLSAL